MKTVEHYTNIGTGTHDSRFYEVAIFWDVVPSFCPRTIPLSEGYGHAAQGSCFTLGALLEETWTRHLETCGCLWLRDLARDEQARNRCFSADEIFALWQKRAKSCR